MNRQLVLIFFCIFISNSNQSFAIELDSTPADILKYVSPPDLKLQIVPKEHQFDSPKHKCKTTTFIRGDFNRDKNQDIAIAAVNKISETSWDGYLVLGSFQNSDWKLVQFQKYELGSGPSLKDCKNGQILFFLSYSGELIQSVVWSGKTQKYFFEDRDSQVLLNSKSKKRK